MIQQLKDNLLHLKTKHTNLSIPYSKYVYGNTFPEQDTNYLNKTIIAKYKDMYIFDLDDSKLAPYEFAEDDYRYTRNKKFRIVRYDKIEPHVMILVAEDYGQILVADNSKYNEDTVLNYPIQLDEYIGADVKDQYVALDKNISGIILRADACEPCCTVIRERINGEIRYVLGDECFSLLNNDFSLNDSTTHSYPPFIHKDDTDISSIRKKIIEGV